MKIEWVKTSEKLPEKQSLVAFIVENEWSIFFGIFDNDGDFCTGMDTTHQSPQASIHLRVESYYSINEVKYWTYNNLPTEAHNHHMELLRKKK